MPEESWSGAEVKFIDYDETLCNLRRAVAKAKALHPEVTRVLLFGAPVDGSWTAASDPDLIVDVRKELGGVFQQGIGISNVRERLRVLYGSEFTFVIQSPPEGGTVIQLGIPWVASQVPVQG